MDFMRRDMLAYGAAAGALALLPFGAGAGAQTSPTSAFAPVASRVRAFAQAVLAQNGFPGMAIAIVGPGGWSSNFAVGLADLDRRTPAAPSQLFQIGSITKSLTAMAVFALAARGRLDLDGRVQRLLPEVPLPRESITIRHLLEHSSGLPNSLEQTPYIDVPGGRLWTGFEPGSRYSYCNLGYTLLGLIVERASGLSWPRALETLVLRPIGMTAAEPVIRIADRARYATGHVRFREDVPWLPRARLTAGRWVDMHSAAGSVAATAPDMVAYLRTLVELGRGKGGPLFPDVLADRYRTPTIASTHGPGARYGNGLATLDVGGHPCFRHTGGMIGFGSAMTVDAAAGAGCYASVNVGGAGGYRPVEVTEYALALVRAAAARQPLPAAPAPRRAPAFADPARLTGRWIDADGREFSIAARGGELWVVTGGVERPLLVGSDGALATDHPQLAPHELALEPGDTPFIRIGGRVYGRTAPAARDVPPRLAALTGNYYSTGAWSPRIQVFTSGDRLFLGTYRVTEAADGSWRFSDPSLVSERVWFEDVAAGRPQNLNFSGTRFSRQPVER
jgi:CubicO group peptidase (beta-lactamase class C family)